MTLTRRYQPAVLPSPLLAAVLVLGLTWTASPSPSQAQAPAKFACQSIQGVPTTVARNKRGQWVPIIQWVSQAFAAEGWTPERRCQEVSSRFNQFYASGQLKYITSGRMNGLPVVCVTPQEAGGCSGQLYTLKPFQNPAETVRKLIAIKNSGGRAPVLRETEGRPYIDLEALIEQAKAAQQSSQPQAGVQPTAPEGESADPLY